MMALRKYLLSFLGLAVSLSLFQAIELSLIEDEGQSDPETARQSIGG